MVLLHHSFRPPLHHRKKHMLLRKRLLRRHDLQMHTGARRVSNVGYTWNKRGFFGNVTHTCVQLHWTRTMLIPLTTVGVFVLELGAARMVVGKEGGDKGKVADETVERLQAE
jgi:hypothetical protein